MYFRKSDRHTKAPWCKWMQEQKLVLSYIHSLCDNKESAYDVVVLIQIYQKHGGSITNTFI